MLHVKSGEHFLTFGWTKKSTNGVHFANDTMTKNVCQGFSPDQNEMTIIRSLNNN